MLELIHKIHNTATMGVMAITGGGAEAIGELLRHGNGSKTLLEAVVPYSNASFDDFLHGKPDKYCSEPTARQLAMAAFQRAKHLVGNAPVFGLGATCSLVKENEREGREHQIYVGLQTATKTVSHSIRLTRPQNREEEERIAAETILNLTVEACGLSSNRLPSVSDPVHRIEYEATKEEYNLINGLVKSIYLPFRPYTGNALVFPGSFNPIHDGHRAIIRHAQELTGLPAVAEISVRNVDKPMLDYLEIHNRCEAVTKDFAGAYLTDAPTFAEKADLFPNTTFLVGTDTLARIANPKYYGGDEEARDKALAYLFNRGVKFIAYRRNKSEYVPLTLLDKMTLIPTDFDPADISSTEIRKSSK